MNFPETFCQQIEQLANYCEQNCDLSSREECGNGRSRQALSNEYIIADIISIGLDTADNGPIKVWGRK